MSQTATASAPYFISAIGTPLDAEEGLHSEGLRAHLADQAAGGVDGILVAGTMGLLQLLSDGTYRELIRQSAELWSSRGETLVGIGDASFTRTRERLRLVNELPVDGTVVLAPYFIKFSQGELVDYYAALASESRAPLYLYDLPQRTGTTLSVETVQKLAEHPNIRGIKCSGDLAQARALADAVARPGFRVILSQPLLVDILLRADRRQHLDGAFAIFPAWVKQMKQCANQQDWDRAAVLSRQLTALIGVLQRYGVFQGMTGILNARGISGNFAPRPHRSLAAEELERLCGEPAVCDLLKLS